MLEDCRDQEPVSKTKMVRFYFANPFSTRDQAMRLVYEPTAQGMHHWKCEVVGGGGGGVKKNNNKYCTLAAFEKKYHTFPECPASSPPSHF